MAARNPALAPLDVLVGERSMVAGFEGMPIPDVGARVVFECLPGEQFPRRQTASPSSASTSPAEAGTSSTTSTPAASPASTGRMRSTVARRLSTLASFSKYCEQEQLVDRNPALNVRRPKVDYESRTLGLDRNELGAFLVQAGLGLPRDQPWRRYWR
jgi:hypothetical protein